MIRGHEPGEAVFRAILPEEIDWKPFPAFPPSVRLAVPIGDPAGPGPNAIRLKPPSGVKPTPHRHPEDRLYTVISGVFYIGLGETFDGDQAGGPSRRAASSCCPADTRHFHWAKSGEYVSQVTADRPAGPRPTSIPATTRGGKIGGRRRQVRSIELNRAGDASAGRR